MTRTQPPWVYEFLSSISEQAVELRFRFHCSCGALIETPETKPTCWNCARAVEVRRLTMPEGEKYFVRIAKRRPDQKRSSTPTELPRPSRKSLDRIGIALQILLSIVWIASLWMGSLTWKEPHLPKKHAAPHLSDLHD